MAGYLWEGMCTYVPLKIYQQIYNNIDFKIMVRKKEKSDYTLCIAGPFGITQG